MTRVFAIAASAATLALLGGLFTYVQMNRPDDAFAQCRQGQVAGGDIGGPFTLVNTAWTDSDRCRCADQTSLVYFGYTFCPDVCPFDMARNVEAVDIWPRGALR
jgi:protein SCO1